MTLAINNERDPWTCPICGVSCEHKDGCEHLAFARHDDSVSDFSESGVFYGSNSEVTHTFDDLYEAVIHFSMIWLAGTSDVREILSDQMVRLSGDSVQLRLTVEVLQTVRSDEAENVDFEDIVPTAYYQKLTAWFIELFNRLWTQQPNAIAGDNWEISSGPGLSWQGTNYWATDGERCLPAICKQIDAVAASIRTDTQAVLDRLASHPEARSSIDRADGWIRFYRNQRNE